MTADPTQHLHSVLTDLQRNLNARADPTLGFTDLVAEHLPAVAPVLDAAFAALTDVDAKLSPSERQAARARHRMLVQPFFLEAAMVRWAVDKPLGYAGDYHLVDLVFDDPAPAATPLGSLLAAWAHAIGPIHAHRARRDWALARLRSAGARHILSFACGPERLLRGIHRDGRDHDITLCDFDSRALEHAEEQMRVDAGPGLRVHTRRVSAHRMIAAPHSADSLLSPAARANHGLDAVLVPGLLDYLTAPQIVRLLPALTVLLRPGGELLLTCLHTANPWRSFMDYTLDWQLEHRTLAEVIELAAAAGLTTLAVQLDEATGTNVFYAGRIP